MKKKITDILNEQGLLALVILIAASVIFAFNSYQIYDMKSGSVITGSVVVPVAVAAAKSDVRPTGVPDIYGQELELSYDDVSAIDRSKTDLTIRKMGQIDRDVTLTGADLERYINILYRLEEGISCEYCCGARSIIFEDGRAACGCAHSYAMRGLAKYLITQHGDEYTDAEILVEVGKWKTLFFPGQMQKKAEILDEQGIDVDYISLASNKYRGIEKGSGSAGGMVGGC